MEILTLDVLRDLGRCQVNSIIYADCLEAMKFIEDKSIDMICSDPPYQITNCKWDLMIPLEPLWGQYKRVIKDNGAIVLTASQPFTSMLVMSNLEMFRQALVYTKTRGTNFFNAKKQFMKWHEDILIFYDNPPVYNPQMRPSGRVIKKIVQKKVQNRSEGVFVKTGEKENYTYEPKDNLLYPKSILDFSGVSNENLHPTQKPVELFEFLIRTYTNEGDLVLDSCAGSFTAAIAAMNTNRNYICIEKDLKYFKIGKNRIENHIIPGEDVA